MIPKIIHYCWLSDDPIPTNLQNYIDGWKKIMPDYQIIKWDRKRIRLEDHPFALQAFNDKRYAFAADYVRAFALYTMGGIYLDSDVEVFSRFDDFLDCSYFTSFETHLNRFQHKLLLNRYIDSNGTRYSDVRKVPDVGLQAAIVGSEKQGALITDIYMFYKSQNYIRYNYPFCITAPTVHSRFAEHYGFKYLDIYQELDENIHIFPSQVFSSIENFDKSKAVALHVCQGSWLPKRGSLKKVLKRFPCIRDMYITIKILRNVKKMRSNIIDGFGV